MKKIISIIGVKKYDSGHSATVVLLDDGDEASGYGIDWKVGEEVERYFDPQWDMIKIRKSRKKS